MSDETIHPFVRGLLERAKFDDGRFEFTSDDERTIVDALAALGTTPQLAELAMELTTLAHWLRTEQNNEVAADLRASVSDVVHAGAAENERRHEDFERL